MICGSGGTAVCWRGGKNDRQVGLTERKIKTDQGEKENKRSKVPKKKRVKKIEEK